MIFNFVSQEQLNNRYSEVNWKNVTIDSGNWSDAGGNGVQTGFITESGLRFARVVRAGYYLLLGCVNYSHNVNGIRDVKFMLNGVEVEYSRVVKTPVTDTGYGTNLHLTSIVYLDSTDQIKYEIYHNSGSTLTINANLKLFML